jgi:outer membrane protein
VIWDCAHRQFWFFELMTTLFKRWIAGVVLFSWLGGLACAQNRSATVDLQKVFDKYWRTEQAIAALKDRLAQFEKSRQEMVEGMKKKNEEYQKLLEDANNQALSAEQRDKRKKEAEDRLRALKTGKDELDQFDRVANATLVEQKARMRKNILDEIKGAVSSKAKAGGYSLVIDSGAQTYVADPTGPYYSPIVIFANDENDLTEAVLSQLNVGAPVTAPTTEEKKGDKK